MKMIATRKNIRLEDNEASSSGEAARSSSGGKSSRRALGMFDLTLLSALYLCWYRYLGGSFFG